MKSSVTYNKLIKYAVQTIFLIMLLPIVYSTQALAAEYRMDMSGSAHWINSTGVVGRYSAKASLCAKQNLDGSWTFTTVGPEHLTVYLTKGRNPEFARFRIIDGTIMGSCDTTLSAADCSYDDPDNPPYCASAQCPLIGIKSKNSVEFPLPNGNAIYDPGISSVSKTSSHFSELPSDPDNCPGGACALMMPTGGSPAPWDGTWSNRGKVRFDGDIYRWPNHPDGYLDILIALNGNANEVASCAE